MFYDSTKAVLWVIFVVYFSTYQLALSSVAPRQWQPKCLYLEAQYRQDRFYKARLASNLNFVTWKDHENKPIKHCVASVAVNGSILSQLLIELLIELDSRYKG